MTTTTTIDWAGAEEIAARLGARTRRLVADRNPQAVIEWARRMSREHSGPAACTYAELVVLLEQPRPDEPVPTAGENLGPPETILDAIKMEEAIDDAA